MLTEREREGLVRRGNEYLKSIRYAESDIVNKDMIEMRSSQMSMFHFLLIFSFLPHGELEGNVFYFETSKILSGKTTEGLCIS